MKVNELLEGTVSTSLAGRRDHKKRQKKLATSKSAISRLNDPEMLSLRRKMKDMSKPKNRFKVVESQDTLDIKFGKHPDGRSVVAVDANSYDGAPDAGSANTYGMGSNKNDAVQDLIDNLEDAGVYPPELLQQALQDYMTMQQGDMEAERNPGGNIQQSRQAAQDAQIMQQGDMEAERGMGIQDERPR